MSTTVVLSKDNGYWIDVRINRKFIISSKYL